MPGMLRWSVVVVVVVFGTLGGEARGQSAAPCTLGMVVYGGLGGAPMKKGAPYTAVTRSTVDQKLPDGNVIHRVAVGRQARDFAGKAMTETMVECVLNAEGQPTARYSVSVYDFPAKVSMSWQVGGPEGKVVRVIHQNETPPTVPSPEEQAANQARNRANSQRLQRESHTDQLGNRNINGLEATGSRNTRTIPIGEEGNEQPLVITHDTWFSKETGLTLLLIDEDPRRGKYTFEYEDLKLGEPDAAVFAPPADYKVQEVHPNATP
jgi:hypothetical protein